MNAVSDLEDLPFEELRTLAEDGDAAAQHVIGCLCDLEPEGAEKAVQWWRKSAAQGHAASMNDLGAAYEEGSGVEQDLQHALMLYLRSAEQGDCQAMANLGRMYEYGIGLPADKVLMVQWYRRAAERRLRIGWVIAMTRGMAWCRMQLWLRIGTVARRI